MSRLDRIKAKYLRLRGWKRRGRIWLAPDWPSAISWSLEPAFFEAARREREERWERKHGKPSP